MKSISIKNTDAIARAISEAEGRATARCITVHDIISALSEVDEHLAMISTKKDAIGTVVHADPCAQAFPNAYKYTPESTHFSAILTPSGWKVTSVSRGRTGGPTSRIRLELTAATVANMAERLSVIR